MFEKVKEAFIEVGQEIKESKLIILEKNPTENIETMVVKKDEYFEDFASSKESYEYNFWFFIQELSLFNNYEERALLMKLPITKQPLEEKNIILVAFFTKEGEIRISNYDACYSPFITNQLFKTPSEVKEYIQRVVTDYQRKLVIN